MLQLADDAERVKTDFLASVSHELRTPLTPIRGYTEILRSRAVPARDASGYLDEIGLAAQRLERVVALLVDVASIEAGRFRVILEDVPPTDLLTETVARWRERSGRRIEVRAPRALPDVLADAAAISRVFDELIDNAFKFAPDGEVEIRARRVGNSVEMSVRDNGPGIDPERLKAVREAFTQEESGDTRRFGGLGLGLTFIEGVLEAHGAELDITTTPGGGTTCTFALQATGSVGRMPPKAQMRKR
jgi:signal transduction histidine kinase